MQSVLNCAGYGVYDINIVRGRGAYIYDEQGRAYADYEAGVWCTVLGHSHPRISRIIGEQAGQIMHLGYRYYNPVVASAAGKVLELLGFAEGKCVFLSSGSEAVELGVQIIRLLTGRPLLLTLSGSYLAAFGSAGIKSSQEWHVLDWGYCVSNNCLEKCNPDCPVLKKVPWQQIGGFVFEPGNAGGQVRLPPRQLVSALAEKVQQHGLILANEVTTGFGRTGAWFGLQHYCIQPDLVAMGKGMGNGYPVSAVAMTGAVAKDLERAGFRYAQSHQNDALGAAVTGEVIDTIFGEDLIRRSWDTGQRFRQWLEELLGRHHCLNEVRGRGLMIALEYKSGQATAMATVHKQLLSEGFLVGHSPNASLFRFYPPLVIDDQEVQALVASLDRHLAECSEIP